MLGEKEKKHSNPHPPPPNIQNSRKFLFISFFFFFKMQFPKFAQRQKKKLVKQRAFQSTWRRSDNKEGSDTGAGANGEVENK